MTQGRFLSSLPLGMEKKGHETFRSDSWEGMLSDLSLEGLACEFLFVEGSSKFPSARYDHQRKDILDWPRGGWSTDPSGHPRIHVPIEVPDPISIPTGLWPLSPPYCLNNEGPEQKGCEYTLGEKATSGKCTPIQPLLFSWPLII